MEINKFGGVFMNREEIKQILKFYKNVDDEIRLNTRIINNLEQAYCLMSCGSILENMLKNKYKKSSPTETAALNVPFSVSETIREYTMLNKRLNNIKTEITKEYNKLPYLQKEIIYDFYIQGFRWANISVRTNYSVTQCKIIRNRGLDKLTRLFSQNTVILKFFS